MPTLTTLVLFNGANGANPHAGLAVDAAGDLFGTTEAGGANNDGTVFEIAKTAGGYATTPTTLITFNGTNGANPYGNLSFDAAGNLYGTTENGGSNGYGLLFEVAKTGGTYAITATALASINVAGGPATNGTNPFGGLVADASGNLFGTTINGGANGVGSVFELSSSSRGYTVSPTTLVSFNTANGATPFGGLIVDASGNLFGTTYGGGANGDGTVFEIAKVGGVYASAPTTLVSFNGANGANPYAGLTADASGNLFGTTEGGGANNGGTVFEIAKTAGGYASAPVTLASFGGALGYQPAGGLIVDGAGNLFGTTLGGGANGDGTVFEIAKTAGGYSSTPIVLASFDASTGYFPYAGLVADASGNLFGTTEQGGPNGDGGVFEISGSGFVPIATIPALTVAQALASYATNPSSAISIADTGADVDGNLDAIESIAAAGKLSGITLTDSSPPTLAVTQAQLTGDAGALKSIGSEFNLGITVSSSNATIAGLGSHDTVILPGASSQYSLSAVGDGTSLTATSTGGVAHLSNINYLQFSDKTVFVENANNASIALLYAAALNRAPDVAGLDGWEDIYANNISAAIKAQGPYVALAETSGGYGGSLSIAAGFTNSAEFQQLYGALNNTQFINLMYQNVLDRAPLASETNAWLAWMTTGDPQMGGQVFTKEMVLVGFAESTENIANTAYSASHTAGWLFAV